MNMDPPENAQEASTSRAEYMRHLRAAKNVEKRCIRVRTRERRTEAPPETTLRLEALSQDHRKWRARESEEDRRRKGAEAQRQQRLNETEEERQSRQEQMSLRETLRRWQETLAKHSWQETPAERSCQETLDKLSCQETMVEHSYYPLELHSDMRRQRTMSRPPVRLAMTLLRPDENDVGPLNVKCEDCGALHFDGERRYRTRAKFNTCCNYGTVVLPPLKPYPTRLKHLLMGDDDASRKFRWLIRHYNGQLAMVSMGSQLAASGRRSPNWFQIHGLTYHNMHRIHLANTHGPQSAFGHIYILDTDVAIREQTTANNPQCEVELVAELGQLLLEVNPLTLSSKMMKDVVAKEEQNHSYPLLACPVRVVFDVSANYDGRPTDVPVANEVAVIFVGDDGELPLHRSLAVHQRDGGLRRISDIDRRCDPLAYPLLFPAGDFGWHPGLVKKRSQRLRTQTTQKEFYCYRLAVRDEFQAIHWAGKLFQQYVVDAYVKSEQNGPYYDRTCRTIHHAYQDALAIVARYGRPDLSVTFECNPSWNEIQENLYEGQVSSDRVDLIARVFRLKLKVLFDDLFKRHVLGRVVAHVSVVEFQKRGLPHCHLLLILADEDKPRTVDDIDRIVQAEIPPKEDERLSALVLRHVVHSPCGVEDPRSQCMVDGSCLKGFPKEFCSETYIQMDGQPRYRRMQGITAMVGSQIIDNRWIVPYNRYLLMQFNAPIHVEVCSTTQSLKCLFKYVYKGADYAALRLIWHTGSGDQMDTYLDARYVSAAESIWRLFTFELQHKSHGVFRLAVHLPQEQQLHLEDAEDGEVDDDEQVQKRSAGRPPKRDTTLTAWFQLNRLSEDVFDFCLEDGHGMVDSRLLHYHQIPEHFIYKRSISTWVPRQRAKNEIARLWTVSPADVERYHLRLLLLNVKGAKSFEELRTVNGRTFATYAEATKEANLVLDDRQYDRTLDEAAIFHQPSESRSVFAALLNFCTVRNAPLLWQKFKGQLAADFRCLYVSEFEAEAAAYFDINDKLQYSRKPLSKYVTIPEVQLQQFPTERSDRQRHQLIGEKLYASLTEDQKKMVVEILASLGTDGPMCFFIDGPCGTGKTYLHTALHHIFAGRGFSVISVAWSGVAAGLLVDGRTVQSQFQLPVSSSETPLVSGLKSNSHEAEFLRKTDVIIWDEAPMTPRNALEAVSALLVDITGITVPFGGKLMILGGDFRQLLPAMPRGPRTDFDACLRNSSLWPNFKVLMLRKNLRANRGNDAWSEFLLELGSGLMETDVDGNITIPETWLSRGDLITEIYGTNLSSQDVESLRDKAILTTKSTDAVNMNNSILGLLPGEEVVYKSIDQVLCTADEATNFPIEFINSLTLSGMPPHKLCLKVGAIVMLLENLNVRGGLGKGTRLVIHHLGDRILICTIVAGPRKGEYVLIPRIDICPSESTGLPFRFTRRQFPVRLAFAMAIDKSQGQTFSRMGVYLRRPVFGHGQLYLALSRVRSVDHLTVLIEDDITKTKTKNIVFREIL